MTRQALVAYSVGLVGMILVKILAPGFYARQNVLTPVKIGVVTLVATQLMNLAFVGPLRARRPCARHRPGRLPERTALVRGICESTDIYAPQPGWPVFILKVLASVAVMAVVLFIAMGEARVVAPGGLAAQSAGDPRRWSLLGAAVYAACLLAFGFRPRDFSRRAAE